MTERERFARIKEIYLQAGDLEPHERSRLLDAACGGDDSLRREVAGLLALRATSENFSSDP